VTVDLAKDGAWIGRSVEASEVLDPWPVRALAATLDTTTPARVAGDPVPLGWHWLYFRGDVRTDALSADGHEPHGAFLPPIEFPRRMWAGSEIVVAAPLRIGDRVTKRSVITSIERKSGRSGPLCFVTIEHAYEVGGRERLRERQSLVFRENRPWTEPHEVAPVTAPCVGRRRFGEVALFRYSALTFNSHRIHFDRTYCQTVERYPDLLVHGPLTATLLADLAATLEPQRPVARFEFTARSPIFVNMEMSLHAERTAEGSARLWAATPGGQPCMAASVMYR
jgi:3-methylfumaryl-CoA hydratase